MELAAIGSQNIGRAVAVLRQGGVIAHPADTCYGLVADFANLTALKKVQAIKGRDGKKPMSIMLPAALQMNLEKYAVLNDFTRRICEELFPGPVTILLPKGPAIPDFYFPETKLIGIRIPYDEFTQDLLNAYRAPLITTSANCSGGTPCYSDKEVLQNLSKAKVQPDLIFEGNLAKNLPSTVILPENNKVKIIRHGPMTKEQLEDILGISVIE